jgi:hypothetical protein
MRTARFVLIGLRYFVGLGSFIGGLCLMAFVALDPTLNLDLGRLLFGLLYGASGAAFGIHCTLNASKI